jgi:hypothetical protein
MSHSLEVTPKETAMGGFAFPVICSHSTNLSYCVDATKSTAEAACALMTVTITSQYAQFGYTFTGVSTLSNGTKRCEWEGRNPSNQTKTYQSAILTTKSGLCPAQDSPPPEQVIFSRNGRWFPQELDSKRCFRSCEYSNGQSFNYKHYVFTNGVMTNFTENMSNRLKSTQTFCDPVPEPSRNSQGEITYDAGCEDNMFKVFCDFVEWFRSDSEMPEAPDVQSKNLDLGNIDGSKINIDIVRGGNHCLPPFERDFTINIMNVSYTHHAKVDLMDICSSLWSMGNFFRVMYLMSAAFIIFRK